MQFSGTFYNNDRNFAGLEGSSHHFLMPRFHEYIQVIMASSVSLKSHHKLYLKQCVLFAGLDIRAWLLFGAVRRGEALGDT